MRKPLLYLAVLLGLLLATAVVSLGVGAVAIPLADIVSVFVGEAHSGTAASHATIIWDLRLPRVLLACLVGAGLGMAGAGYQGLFRNPLADPFVIGASSGAALGATIVIVLELETGVLGLAAVPVAALAGSLLAVSAVYVIGSVGRQVSMVSLLLAGVATSSFIGAVVSLLMFLHDEKLVTIFGWLMGSLSGRGWPALRAAAPLIVLGSGAMWLLARPLDALTFGEETAASLGVHLGRQRTMIIVAASLATAACVAAGGIIGFVGLIAPHLARMLVGARHALVFPASGLVGGILLVIADDLARTVASPSELPVGVVTALLGSPFFLSLLKSRQRGMEAR